MKPILQNSSRLKLCAASIMVFLGISAFEFPQDDPAGQSKLVTPLLNITFDAADGLPLQYDLPELDGKFRGRQAGHTIKVVVRKAIDTLKPPSIVAATKTGNGEIYIPGKSDTLIIPRLLRTDILENRADIYYEGMLDRARVVSFCLRYTVDKQLVSLTLEEVSEQNGYELVEVHTPSLVTVLQSDGKTWLAHGDGGGYFTDLVTAKPCILKDGWSADFPYFPNFSYLPLVMMGNGKVNCSMEVQGYLSNTQIEVSGDVEKFATMGVKSYFRVKGESITSLPVEQKEICRLDFTGDFDGNQRADWLDAGKSVRDRMPLIPTHYYDERMIWIISGQPGRAKEATITFPGIEKVIRKISFLTGGVPQAVYISGWTEGGHDTGYPNITQLNEKMGGLPGFMQLKEKAGAYDANISFDDNYDDQFNNEYSKGHFDEKYIARNPDGSLMQQRAWNGEDMSHISGMAKYMQDGGPGMERVRFTCQEYGLQKTELVDAVTWWSIRNDWDPEHPASAVKNLRDGKFKLISEYEKYGVYIISELLRYPFIGKLALVVDGPDGGGWNGFGGTQIPLQRLVYSRSIIYGPGGGDGVARDPRLTLLHNSRRGPWISEKTPDDDIMNYYYLNFLPWTKLHALDILSFERNGQVISMELDNHSAVRIDYGNKEGFSAVYQGIQIMDGNSLTCPVDKNRIAFYSKTERTLSYPIPENADKSKFRAKVLFDDRETDFPYKLVNGGIEITVPSCRPVIFYH
jgi:hypothetical protein